jgi:hypothetical protein
MLAFQLRISGVTPASKRWAETHGNSALTCGQEEVRVIGDVRRHADRLGA